MIEKIISAYENLNAELIKTMPFNDSKTREMIRTKLEDELTDCNIKCDEENNPPLIIDECVAVAKVWWKGEGHEIKYVDLIFGNPEQVIKYQVIKYR